MNYRRNKTINPEDKHFSDIFADTFRRSKKSKNSIVYFEELKHITKNDNESEIIFEVNDCLIVASRETKTGKVCLLNHASDLCPGGGVAKKKGSQEESICRRTNLYKNIIDHKNLYYFDILTKFNAENKIKPQNRFLSYKIMLELKNYKPFALFSPEISIIKDENHKLIGDPKIISVITYASIRNPFLIDGEYDDRHYSIMDKKIKMLLFIAKENNIDTLILGAWGCNVFKNPMHQVAQIFHDNLKNTYFKKVIFAINDAGMLEKFKTEFNSFV